jgi:undecaprenyl-diphosphatase
MKSLIPKSEFAKRMLTSCFGLGLLPGAPGTFASLLAAIIFAGLLYLGTAVGPMTLAMDCLVLAGAVICILFAPAIEALTGRKDPPEIVADELAGQAATYLVILSFVPAEAIGKQVLLIAAGGFILFRLFDIAKPWPIRRLERLPAGLGILADDLMAGLYAGLLTAAAITFKTSPIAKSLQANSSQLNILTSAFLGMVQGLTEFLPVSSSGHLALFEHISGLGPEKSEMLLFDLVLHTGTVIAIIIVFRKSIAVFLKAIVKGSRNLTEPIGLYKNNFSFRFLILAFIATAVTAVPGFILKEYFERARGSLITISIMWIITGILLTATDFRKKTRVGLRQFGVVSAIVVGLFQAAAIMPGISRSGATIAAAILLGLHRRWAVEFSFLLAIPAILGATAVELVKNYDKFNSHNLSLIIVLTGLCTAVVAGTAALKILIRVARRAKLKTFAFYCFILACCVLIYRLQ